MARGNYVHGGEATLLPRWQTVGSHTARLTWSQRRKGFPVIIDIRVKRGSPPAGYSVTTGDSRVLPLQRLIVQEASRSCNTPAAGETPLGGRGGGNSVRTIRRMPSRASIARDGLARNARGPGARARHRLPHNEADCSAKRVRADSGNGGARRYRIIAIMPVKNSLHEKGGSSLVITN